MILGLAILVCLNPSAIDGDTVKCSWSNERVRIFGIQAPEAGTSGSPASTANMQKLSMGGLYCEIKGASYNRLVAQCYNYLGQDVGLQQLQGHYATEWCYYSKNIYGTCS